MFLLSLFFFFYYYNYYFNGEEFFLTFFALTQSSGLFFETSGFFSTLYEFESGPLKFIYLSTERYAFS